MPHLHFAPLVEKKHKYSSRELQLLRVDTPYQIKDVRDIILCRKIMSI